VQEHAPARDEGVEGVVVDEDDVDARLRETRGIENRAGILADERLDLGVANDRYRSLLGVGGQRLGSGKSEGEGPCDQRGRGFSGEQAHHQLLHDNAEVNDRRVHEKTHPPRLANL
jgi:hypothetical protein